MLFPMVAFKPATRSLTVDDVGIETMIGQRHSTIAWEEFANIQENGDVLIIQRRNLNAFIIPARAFASAKARQQFRDFVMVRVPEPEASRP